MLRAAFVLLIVEFDCACALSGAKTLDVMTSSLGRIQFWVVL